MTLTDGFGQKMSFCNKKNESGIIQHPPLIMIPPVPGKLLRSGIPQVIKISPGDCIVEYQPFPFNSKVLLLLFTSIYSDLLKKLGNKNKKNM